MIVGIKSGGEFIKQVSFMKVDILRNYLGIKPK